jgi:hypothetical protein
MNNKGALKARTPKKLAESIRLNLLLGCGESALADFELARLGAVADLRKQLYSVLDMMIEQTAQAMLARWFRDSDRESIKRALDSEESPMDWAIRLIRERGQSKEELVPLAALPAGAAHLTASLRYAERNLSEGKCAVCPQPQARNSVRYCERHLTAQRLRHKPKGSAAPGSIDYLYMEEKSESRHGRQPGSLAAAAMGREKASRALLAELGLPPDSAAVSLKATKEALLQGMPNSKETALPASKLFSATIVTSPSTGKAALKQLFEEGAVQRSGKGSSASPYRYFANQHSQGQPK